KLPSDQDTMNIKYWGIAYPIEPEKINSETGNLKGISFTLQTKKIDKSYEGLLKYNPTTRLVYSISGISSSRGETYFNNKTLKTSSKDYIEVKNQITDPAKN
ncbi:MAG: hypothetical protein ACRCVT_14105, partial [Leadbetterella sp.]